MLVIITAQLRIGICFSESLNIVYIFAFDIIRYFDKVVSVSVEACALVLGFFLACVADIHKRPERAEHCRAERGNQTGIHKYSGHPSAHIRAENHHQASEQHRDCHCKRRSDSQNHRAFFCELRIGGRFNNNFLRTKRGDNSRRTVEINIAVLLDIIALLTAERRKRSHRLRHAKLPYSGHQGDYLAQENDSQPKNINNIAEH